MNPLEFLIKFIERFAPVGIDKKEYMREQATKWYASSQVNDNKILSWIKSKGEEWYVMFILCFVYFFAVRWMHDFLNPDTGEDDEI